MAAGDPGARMRASDEDRARVQAVLNDAFAEGRLTKYEWEHRAGALSSAVTWADLDELTADLPLEYPGPRYQGPRYAPVPAVPDPGWMVPAQSRTNSMAAGALACGLGQVLVGFPAGIAAIILGRKAQQQIRMTGEQGGSLARAGIVLGWIGISLTVMLVLLVIVGSLAATSYP